MKITTIYEVEDLIPQGAIEDICQSGDNCAAVELWQSEIKFEATTEILRKIVEEWGSLEVKDEDLRLYVIWIAAWNVYDNQQMERG